MVLDYLEWAYLTFGLDEMMLGICQIYLPGCSDILFRMKMVLALMGQTQLEPGEMYED